jgi:2'-5' RNA ligase
LSEPRLAVIVPVPEASAVVDGWRERTCNAKPSAGVPPHVTLLFPLVAPITDELISSLADVFAPVAQFALELRELRRFPGVLYLAPEPAAPFEELTHELVRRYPEHPPYGGEPFPVVPHLTVAQGDDELLGRVEVEFEAAASLPIVADVREAVLLEEGSPWRTRAHFPFRA